jgi:hypothetical protein
VRTPRPPNRGGTWDGPAIDALFDLLADIQALAPEAEITYDPTHAPEDGRLFNLALCEHVGPPHL